MAAGWLLDLLGLPPEAGVGFTTGATMANFTALAAARNALLRRAGWDVEAQGLFGAPEIHVVLGGEAHSSVYLTLRLLGFGAERVLVAAADAEGRMRPEALAAVLGGLDGPVVVCLQAGNVVSGAFDPFAALIPAGAGEGRLGARRRGVRALGAGGAGLAALTTGLADADSWAADGHKWLQVPYDCGFAIVRDAAALQRAMSISASYLPSGDEPGAGGLLAGDVAAGARLRGLGGADGAGAAGGRGDGRAALRGGAGDRGAARAEPGIAVLNEVVLNQVAVACGDGRRADALTRAVLAEVQADGVSPIRATGAGAGARSSASRSRRGRRRSRTASGPRRRSSRPGGG